MKMIRSAVVLAALSTVVALPVLASDTVDVKKSAPHSSLALNEDSAGESNANRTHKNRDKHRKTNRAQDQDSQNNELIRGNNLQSTTPGQNTTPSNSYNTDTPSGTRVDPAGSSTGTNAYPQGNSGASPVESNTTRP